MPTDANNRDTLSTEYQNLLKITHASRPPAKPWGTTGARNAGSQIVSTLRGRGDVISVLDFGAGQGRLGEYVKKELPYLEWTNYDPGIPGIDVLPERKFDFIVSSDMLEHVEPERVNNVLFWMKEHAKRGMFHHIACDPCGLILPDGRNAHLTVQPPEWWRDQIVDNHWSLMLFCACQQRKRGGMKTHAVIQVDRVGG